MIHLSEQICNQSFQDISAFSSGRVTLTGDGEPERVRSESTTANYFSLLGVSPAIGRTYTPEEDSPAGTSVAVLSHSLWQRRFGGDTDILGQPLTINGNSIVVVGVMSADFKPLNTETELWLPLRLNPANDYRG